MQHSMLELSTSNFLIGMYNVLIEMLKSLIWVSLDSVIAKYISCLSFIELW